MTIVDGQIQQLELSVANLPKIKVDLTLNKIRDAIEDQTKVHVYYGSSYEDNIRILRVLRKYRMNAELAGVRMIWLHASSTRDSSECRIENGLSCYIRKGASEQEILSLLHQSYGELAATTDDEWMDILKQVALEIENTGKTKQRIGKKD